MDTQEGFVSSSLFQASPRYLIPELTYDYGHPDVVFWTRFFSDRAKKLDLFANIDATIRSRRSRAAAETMGQTWCQFTRHVPKFITRAVSLTNDPERQHHLIQIAYDELGGSDKKVIHSNLFLEALSKIDIHFAPGSSLVSIYDVLAVLDTILADAESEEAIIGLLLSFEIVAQENIEMLFECLSFDASSRETLSASRFFQIHRQDETEHIRHSVANFLRFCTTETHRADFLRSFDEGLKFWELFWDRTSRLINVATNLCAKVSQLCTDAHEMRIGDHYLIERG